MTRLPLAVTMGEPAGIGGEITLKAWRDRSSANLPPFLTIDDPQRLQRLAQQLGIGVPVIAVHSPQEALDVFGKALPVLSVSGAVRARPGVPDRSDAPLVIQAIEQSVELSQSGMLSGVVTNPISKADLYAVGFRHPGHTEFIGALCDTSLPVMMLAGPELRAVPATIHCALADVPGRINRAMLHAMGRITAAALHRDFGIGSPRVAFSGLNPHAGEGGAMGRQEIEIITPAIEDLVREGIDAFGPIPADSMFHPEARETYDAAICMYHDQALIPVKTLDFHRTVNVTLGLPIIRTSPDHGTAYDIAGSGIARADSLMAAIRMAGDMAENRANHDRA